MQALAFSTIFLKIRGRGKFCFDEFWHTNQKTLLNRVQYTLFILYVAFISMLYIINGILLEKKTVIIYDLVNNVHAPMILKKVYQKHLNIL